MMPQLFLHRSRVYALQPPRLAGPLFGFFFALALLYVFGQTTTAGMTGRFPGWLRATDPHGDRVARGLLIALGLANGFGALLAASAYGIKTWSLLGHKLGWHPVRESEGPCRLVQDSPGLWGLQMELTGGRDPGSPWPLTTRNEPAATCHLLFRLDEAAAGAVSRLFDPGDRLRVRWFDLPATSGGPTLLEIRSADVEALAAAITQQERLAA